MDARTSSYLMPTYNILCHITVHNNNIIHYRYDGRYRGVYNIIII